MTDRLANAQERAIKMMETTFKQCYQEGYKDGYEEGHHYGEIDGVMNIQIDEVSYQRGLNDAWECAKKIAEREDDMRNCFHDIAPAEIFGRYSALEAIAKIKEYEEKKETQGIKVGDIVTVGEDDAEEFIVTFVSDEHLNKVTLISRNGFHARTARIVNLTKTGEHCDIEKCFKR